MSVTITADTSVDEVAQRLGVGSAEELRTSRSRREPHLQKYARLLSGDPGVNLILNPQIAAANMEIGNEIYIPCSEFDQPVTDIPERTYDLLVQEMLTTHEVGHLLFSDWPSLKEDIESVEAYARSDDDLQESPEQMGAVFKNLWNAAEDGVIEAELSRMFVVEKELELMNANFSQAGSVAKATHDANGEEVYTYSMRDAFTQALLDYSVYNSGKTQRLLDDDDPHHTFFVGKDRNLFRERLDEIEKIVEELRQEPDAAERNHQFREWFLKVAYPALRDSEVPGVEQSTNDHGMEETRSDDAHEGIGEAQGDLEFVPNGSGQGQPGDEEDDEGAAGGAGGDEEGEGSEDSSGQSSGSEGQQEPQEQGSAETEIEKDYNEALQEEAREAIGEATMDEIEKFIDVMQAGTPVDIDHITIPEEQTPNREVRDEARRLGRQIKPIIENQLRESRMNAFKRNKSFGELDTRSMVDAERGSLRVFQRPNQPDEKDYSCVLVLDRSGSMNGSIRDVEISVGAFMYALEPLGVDTMCLDFAGNELRLAKPFGESIDQCAGTLFTGEVGGGTPLSDSLFFARRRIEEGAGTHPFIMVMTDGGAGRMDRYQEELAKTPCPVIGLYLRDSQMGHGQMHHHDSGQEMKEFHRWTQVGSNDNLAMKLQQLAREVMV